MPGCRLRRVRDRFARRPVSLFGHREDTKGTMRMARLFGTDGVRGWPTSTSRPSSRCRSSVAAAHVLAGTPGRAGRRPKAVVGRDPRASGEFLSAAVVAGPRLGRRRRPRRRRAAHSGGRVPHRRHGRRLRRDAVRLAQRHARQRHQVLRRRRAQAARRRRGRDRGQPRPGVGASHRRPGRPGRTSNRAGQARYVAHLLEALPHRPRRAHRRHRRRPRRRVGGLARGVPPRRGRGRRDRRRARRAQHQRRLRLHPPRPPQGRGRGPGRRPRHRPRRRRRPVPGRRRRRATRSTATRSWPSSRSP